MFKDMKVATRLLSGFFVLTFIGALVAGIGIYNMHQLNSAADSLYDQDLLGISHLKEANINLIYIHRAVRC